MTKAPDVDGRMVEEKNYTVIIFSMLNQNIGQRYSICHENLSFITYLKLLAVKIPGISENGFLIKKGAMSLLK